jgi:hypothetical protein
VIDLLCSYRPGRAHSRACDARSHEALVRDIADSIDPPIFRAVADDHELCPVYPCVDCRDSGLYTARG